MAAVARVALVADWHWVLHNRRFPLARRRMGLSLAASDICGCRAVAEDGVNGFLVPPRAPAALAGALDHLLRDGPLRRAMGRASRAGALERFDERLILAYYETLCCEFVLPATIVPS